MCWHVKALAQHPDFTISNPNRARALYMALAVNPAGFHDAGGEGYRMIGDLILTLDPINAQTAARFVPSLGRWRRVEPGRGAMMRPAGAHSGHARPVQGCVRAGEQEPWLRSRSSAPMCWALCRTGFGRRGACRWARWRAERRAWQRG
jgi:hypothetical protein